MLLSSLTGVFFGLSLMCGEAKVERLFVSDQLVEVASGCAFTEGPAFEEGTLYFSDGANDRIMSWQSGEVAKVFRSPCGKANGMIFDHQGRLVMCQSSGKGGGRRVTRLEADASEQVLAATLNGKRFIAPNDLCEDSKGRLYFTDPYYGPPAEKSQPVSGVYRIDQANSVHLVIEDLKRPNGILITPDDRYLYVSDRGTQKLHRYNVAPDGSLAHDRVLHDFAPDRGIDGMCLDNRGRIYAAAGKGETTGLYVLSPKGDLLKFIRTPQFATNVTFGGPNGKHLFITASTSVYRLETTTAGQLRHGKSSWGK